ACASRTRSSRSRVSVRLGQTCGVAKRTLVPCSAAVRQSAMPSSRLRAPSSPDGTTWEWTSQNTPRKLSARLLGAEIEPEVRRRSLELAEGARFKLAYPLA